MLIKGAMICDANGEYKGDIRIKDDKIIEINRSIIAHDSEEILEANGLVAMPSAIDLNVQLQSFNKENLIIALLLENITIALEHASYSVLISLSGNVGRNKRQAR